MKKNKQYLDGASWGAGVQEMIDKEKYETVIQMQRELIELLFSKLATRSSEPLEAAPIHPSNELAVEMGVLKAIKQLMSEGQALIISKDLENKWKENKN